MEKSSTTLQVYGGHDVQHIGKTTLRCAVDQQKPAKFDFFITESKSPPILRLQACISFGLVEKSLPDTEEVIAAIETPSVQNQASLTKEAALKEFSDQFTCLGKQEPYHIHQKPEIQPTIDPPRRVALSVSFHTLFPTVHGRRLDLISLHLVVTTI